MIRRSTSYGPPLPDGVLEEDGVDRGLLFTCIVADLARQFEFVQTEWINEGNFIGAPDEMDPMVGPNDGNRGFHRSPEADPPAPDGAAAVCRQPRRRVLLHAGPGALRWIAGQP